MYLFSLHSYYIASVFLLSQRRDDAVPIVLLKPIEEIRKEFHHEIDTTLSAIEKNKKSQELPRSTESDDSD